MDEVAVGFSFYIAATTAIATIVLPTLSYLSIKVCVQIIWPFIVNSILLFFASQTNPRNGPN